MGDIFATFAISLYDVSWDVDWMLDVFGKGVGVHHLVGNHIHSKMPDALVERVGKAAVSEPGGVTWYVTAHANDESVGNCVDGHVCPSADAMLPSCYGCFNESCAEACMG